MSDKRRVILFIDGSNFYHGLKKLGLSAASLNYEEFSRRLVGDNFWAETRYYAGRAPNVGDKRLYRDQRQFLQKLGKSDKVTVHLGRIERRLSNASQKLVGWLSSSAKRMDPPVPDAALAELRQIAEDGNVQYVEKAVDVGIAVDMVALAYQDKYDIAYLLSADGDFTPAVAEAQRAGRKVFVALCPSSQGSKIRQAADGYVPLPREFFAGCWE